jgi:hypothetical protein
VQIADIPTANLVMQRRVAFRSQRVWFLELTADPLVAVKYVPFQSKEQSHVSGIKSDP